MPLAGHTPSQLLLHDCSDSNATLGGRAVCRNDALALYAAIQALADWVGEYSNVGRQ
jgi:hypothetical protein